VPITIGPPFPISPLSPGQLIAWSSDFVGPLPTGSSLSVGITSDTEGTLELGTTAISTVAKQGQFTIFSPRASWTQGHFALATGANVFVQLQLHQGTVGTVVDSGTQEMIWQPSSNVALVDPGGTTTQPPGGLTDVQALQLQQTQEATWPEHLVDQLTTVNLGTGNSSTPINANLTSPVFGIIVRITTIPPDLKPQTPDENYWVPTLAVVRIFRGSDLWLRIPIHTSSKLINLWMEGLALGLADAVLSAGWLLNLTLQTSFLPGVAGQVLLMRVP